MASAAQLSRQLLFRLAGADVLAPALRAVGRGLLSILKLHRFTDPDAKVVGTDPGALRDHLAYLRRHRYRLVSLTEMLTLLRDGDAAGVPAVAFTVDDGHADFARVGAPLFAEYDCPVTLFVTTGFVDGQLWLWWDRVAHMFQQTQRSSITLGLGPARRTHRWSNAHERTEARREVVHHLERLDTPEREPLITDLAHQLDVELSVTPPPAYAPVTWTEVRQMARHGVTYGPHTVTHRILNQAPRDACDWEIQESYRQLRRQTDACVPVFCYPAGRAGPREFEAVRRAGLEAAVTTTPAYAGLAELGTLARFALPRFPCPDDRPHLVNVVAGLARFRGQVWPETTSL